MTQAGCRPSGSAPGADEPRQRPLEPHGAGLYEEALRRGEGRLSADGALVVRTGVHTGRSPNDKFFVDDTVDARRRSTGARSTSRSRRSSFRALYKAACWPMRSAASCSSRTCYAGADPAHRIGVRVVTTNAWHNLFARNMFIRPGREELDGFKPDFTILHAAGFQADPGDRRRAQRHLRRAVNFAERVDR